MWKCCRWCVDYFLVELRPCCALVSSCCNQCNFTYSVSSTVSVEIEISYIFSTLLCDHLTQCLQMIERPNCAQQKDQKHGLMKPECVHGTFTMGLHHGGNDCYWLFFMWLVNCLTQRSCWSHELGLWLRDFRCDSEGSNGSFHQWLRPLKVGTELQREDRGNWKSPQSKCVKVKVANNSVILSLCNDQHAMLHAFCLNVYIYIYIHTLNIPSWIISNDDPNGACHLGLVWRVRMLNPCVYHSKGKNLRQLLANVEVLIELCARVCIDLWVMEIIVKSTYIYIYNTHYSHIPAWDGYTALPHLQSQEFPRAARLFKILQASGDPTTSA